MSPDDPHSSHLVKCKTPFLRKAGRISIEDDPRQGRPTFQRTDENVQKITDLIKENPRTTLLELEQDTGISKTTIGRIVTEDLRLKNTPAKFIPRFLTNEQKLCRLATCEDMLEMTRTDPEWKDKIITGDETWVYSYDPETKRQSAEWRGQGEPRPKKSRILKSRNKVLLVAFLDKKGIVHPEYLPAGQTVIKEMYLSILRRLREAIRKKRPEKWTNGDWILHHDNARPHTAHLVTSFLAKNGTEILPQPPYSPDTAPNDLFLFPKLKAVLKGRHFDTREDIIEKSLLALKSIPKEAYKTVSTIGRNDGAEYLGENYMTLNESKSKVMVFRNGGKPSREDRWYWNGKPLMVTRRYNYLGYPLNDVYVWVRDHRMHHKFVDTDADPHNIKRGFFFAHMGWLMCKKHPDVIEKGKTIDMSDVLADPLVRFQRKYFKLLVLVFSLILPTLFGVYVLGESYYISFCVLAMSRYMLILHGTWTVNSLAHYAGYQTFDKSQKARDNIFVSFITLGEGWHNYHHVFPWDYSTSELGYFFNFSKYFIDLMAKIGQAYDLRSATISQANRWKYTKGDGLQRWYTIPKINTED
ncbi:SCD [Cordylochernes scorpioides]|uniref:SCD n=1 Tax=Cordylochernes scorpioides TaxID=51811 RepID=A0ABY6L8W0_9ARAC|nr:SCD [Cordylochernes scorpioides]